MSLTRPGAEAVRAIIAGRRGGMCAALWTRNLQHGLPSGKAKQLTSRDATSQLVAYASVSWRHGVVQVAATRDGVCREPV